MKLGPVTKIDKGNNMQTSNLADNVMLTNCDVIVFFLIYGQFRAIRNPDSGHMAYKTYIFINSNLCLT